MARPADGGMLLNGGCDRLMDQPRSPSVNALLSGLHELGARADEAIP